MRTELYFVQILALCSALACSAPPKERAASGVPQPSATPTAPAVASPITDRALAAVRKLGTAHSFRAAMTTVRKPVESVKTNLEIVLPDRFRISGEQYQAIIVGPDTYVKFPGKTWQKSTANLEVTNLADPQKLADYLGTASGITELGPQVMDGTPTRVYQAQFPFAPSSKVHLKNQPFTVKLWVREADGRLRKLEGTTALSQSTTTILYYDYDARLEIAPPIN
ncbi:MAG TPA: hypothetical protein VJ302_31285 [Blastocatellia bacterium]|nr:hypothetical protein [Blastocatellia bacterium]